MYNDFFGLHRSPFELSPDPFFLFSSERNKDALASVYYAICRRKGFIVMTGEVGTGKTLMLRCLFELWEREQIPYAYFIGPRLSTMDFLSYMTFELGIKVAEPSKGKLLRALYGFLLAQFEKGLTTVLVIDEAHQMPRSVLEEIRLLTNFETAQQKLLQILLVGQPELDTKLDSVELRSLKQRIAARCRLEPLLEEEVKSYILRRLELSGAGEQAAAIFPPETVHAIYRYSLGIPRLVNSICDQALIAAYQREVRVVPVEVIEQIAFHFRLKPAGNLGATTRVAGASPVEYGADKFPANAPAANVPSAKAAQAAGGANAPNTDNDTSPSLVSMGPNVPVAPPIIPGASREGGDIEIDEAGDERTLERKNIAHEKDGAAGRAQAVEAADRAAVNGEALNLQGGAGSGARVHAQQSAPSSSPSPPTLAAPTQSSANGPVIDALPKWTPDSAMNKRDVSTLLEGLTRVRRWFESLRRPSLALGAIAILAAVLVTGVIMARHSTGVAASQHQTANTPAAVPAGPQTVQQTAALRPAEAGPARNLNGGAVGSPTPRPEGGPLKSAEVPERVPPRTKVVVEALARPVAKPSAVATSVEPPVVGMPPKDLDGGKSLLGISEPNPVPPVTRAGGRLQPPKLISSPAPAYPPRARLDEVQGVVVIDALVDENGKVTEMKVLSGPASLTQAAMAALRTWKYEPARLAGQPIATHIKVSINFNLH